MTIRGKDVLRSLHLPRTCIVRVRKWRRIVDTDQYTETVVLQAEGQFWILKDRVEVCGTGPDDAEVPSSICEPACNTN